MSLFGMNIALNNGYEYLNDVVSSLGLQIEKKDKISIYSTQKSIIISLIAISMKRFTFIVEYNNGKEESLYNYNLKSGLAKIFNIPITE